MRFLTHLVLSFGLAAAAHAQSFPVPVSAERPVSDVVLTGAAGAQWDVHAATNGDIALMAWRDSRAPNWAVYAARVDGDGNVLDPLGVRIYDNFRSLSISAVVWNGHAFVVVVGQTLIFISPDMAISGTKVLDLPQTYGFAAATSGSPLRLLFAERGLTTGNIAIVDSEGNVISRRLLWSNPVNWTDSGWAAGGGPSGFLLLRSIRDGISNTQRLMVERIDADGNSISSTASTLPFVEIRGNEGIAGGSDGFLVMQQSTYYSDVIAYTLDASGVYHGQQSILAAGEGGAHTLAYYPPVVVREEGRYVAVWHSWDNNKGVSEEWVAEIRIDGSATVRRIAQWTGTTAGIAFASGGGRRFMASSVRRAVLSDADLFTRLLSPSLLPGDARLLAFSGTSQQNVQIAAGMNGYAVTWAESGTDQAVHLYVRRFSAAGVPQDPAPLPVLTISDLNATRRTKIVSNGETYLIGCQASQYVIRRLAARTGVWIDPQPVSLPGHWNADVASNGTDALAVSIGSCGGGPSFDYCVVATSIPMSSRQPGAPVVSLHVPQSSMDLTVASNGVDYLAAWGYAFFSPFPGTYAPYQLHAVRLRSDGTALDASPLELDNGKRYPRNASIAWNGGRYLVAWVDSVMRGTRVTAEGAVHDRDENGGGVMLVPGSAAPRAVAFDRRFVVLFRSGTDAGALKGVAFAPDADFAAVRAMPHVLFTTGLTGYDAVPTAAANGGVLAVGYLRLGDHDTGGVSRAFLRTFRDAARRRAAGR